MRQTETPLNPNTMKNSTGREVSQSREDTQKGQAAGVRGAARGGGPRLTRKHSGFWAQGVGFGVDRGAFSSP